MRPVIMLLVTLLLTTAAEAQNCDDTVRKICKSRTGHCGAVYIADELVNPACKQHNAELLFMACGDRSPTLFKYEKECIVPVTSNNCPESVSDITKDHVATIANCPNLHAALCQQVCGARYNHINIREFRQTGRKPGLLCQDMQDSEIKNGVAYSDDINRKACTENHQGNSGWCINYNKTIHDVELGAFVQCAGKTR